VKPPRLRTVEKYKPPYPLNRFPGAFAYALAREVVYLLATRDVPRLEGQDWEEVFARIVGANWKPSNVGLDDVVLEQCAWGAKTVKNQRPSDAKTVRLISGRNSPVFSFGKVDISREEPAKLGEMVLSIWNERVAAVKRQYKHLRTVVLLKSDDLLELSVFEFDTEQYDSRQFTWQRNKSGNIEGIAGGGVHRFTWQPHGSQFTIIEDVPHDRLALRIRKPPLIDRDKVLETVEFDRSWVEIL